MKKNIVCVFSKFPRFQKWIFWKVVILYLFPISNRNYSEFYQVSNMELFVKIVNGCQELIILIKSFVLDICQGSEYTFVSCFRLIFNFTWKQNMFSSQKSVIKERRSILGLSSIYAALS